MAKRQTLSLDTKRTLRDPKTTFEQLGSQVLLTELLGATEGVAERIRRSERPLISDKGISLYEDSRRIVAGLLDDPTRRDIQHAAPNIYALETYANLGNL